MAAHSLMAACGMAAYALMAAMCAVALAAWGAGISFFCLGWKSFLTKTALKADGADGSGSQKPKRKS